jgi:drug/metabolite transporter (DMT)-like permease
VVAQFLLLHPLTPWGLPAPVYGYAVAIALGSTVLPVFMTSEVLRTIGTNRVAIIGADEPVTTILFGCLGLEENMTLLQIAGAELVLVGVILVSLKVEPATTKGLALNAGQETREFDEKAP